jgi:hypothetical protein
MATQQQIDSVRDLRKRLYEARDHVRMMEADLKGEEERLQSVCNHDYVAEDNGDYHRPGYYYTCSICNHFTCFKPSKFRRL